MHVLLVEDDPRLQRVLRRLLEDDRHVVEVAPDGLSVRLSVDKLQEGHVHELHLDGVHSTDNQPLLHPAAFYTLNYLPE